MNNIIEAKAAAEKLSISQLKAFRSWVSDRIGQLERQAKTEEKDTLSSEERGRIEKTISIMKTVLVTVALLLFSILFASCSKDLMIVETHQHGVKMIEWLVDPDGYVSAEWEYPDGRTGGTDFTDEINVPYLIDEQRPWPECANLECRRVTLEGECWRHDPIYRHL